MNRIAKLSCEQRLEVATKHVLTLNDWGFQYGKYIKSSEMDISPRTFRTLCEDVLYLFCYDVLDFMVISNRNGYTISNSTYEIENYLKRKRTQFCSISANYYSLKKAMETKFNMTIDEV